MMKAGEYYIGDLCYVMHEKWNEFCDITITEGGECLDGEFKFANGVAFASYGTMHGDGMYFDNLGNGYGVDAGLIGCIKMDDINFSIDDNLNALHNGLGHVIKFDRDFETEYVDETGQIIFGNICIETGDGDGDEDEDDF